jgi:hypothetical protein
MGPLMALHELGISIAIAMVVAGLLFYWRLSWYGVGNAEHGTLQKLKSDIRCVFRLRTRQQTDQLQTTFATFFLGGRKVGGELTGNTNWSLCFAFANAIWYFAFLGYSYGVWAFVLQIPWTF